MEQVTAIDKALDVLFHLNAHAHPQGVSEIGRALSLPKSSAHRLLAALLRRGLVERDGRGRYRPGIGLLSLAVGVLDREPLIAAARGVLEEQAASLDETFFVVGARAGRLIVLEKVEGTGFLRASPRVGSAVPVHATAAGKLYLAHAPAHVEGGGRNQRFTSSTRIGAQALAHEVELARERGYALNRDEWIEGLCVIAAPVFAPGGIVGAVCVAMSSTRFARLEEAELGQRVRDAAARISSRLTGRAA
jgi:DNA-binding IclR family transcriptional regulator